jgi:hypothetical protein
MLDGPHFPGAAHARLHFIRYKQDFVFIANIPQTADKRPAGSNKPTFSQYRLDN